MDELAAARDLDRQRHDDRHHGPDSSHTSGMAGRVPFDHGAFMTGPVHLLCRRRVNQIIDGVTRAGGRGPSRMRHTSDGCTVLSWSEAGARLSVSIAIAANGAFLSSARVDGGDPLVLTVASAQTLPAAFVEAIAAQFPEQKAVAL